MWRVCKKGGKIIIIKGNGMQFANFVFSFLFPGEAGMRDSTLANIKTLTKGFGKVSLHMAEPCNIARVMLHHTIGIHSLA